MGTDPADGLVMGGSALGNCAGAVQGELDAEAASEGALDAGPGEDGAVGAGEEG